MLLKRLAIIAGLAGLLVALDFSRHPALAHPHVWIDMTTKVLFDKDGRVRGLGIHWVFDPFYSLFLGLRVKELAKTEGKAAHATFVKNMVSRIKRHGYFTEATADKKRLDFASHENTSAGQIKNGKEKGRFWVRFELKLKEAVDPKSKTFTYAVYDPTYYIEILHRERKPAYTMAGIAKDVCQAFLIKPKPDAAAQTFAASLDKTESAGDGLGQLFAEKVTLQCR
jgi:ABC-type uncharacterized transport system substrate-binding protein